jgi:hypothetical protein
MSLGLLFIIVAIRFFDYLNLKISQRNLVKNQLVIYMTLWFKKVIPFMQILFFLAVFSYPLKAQNSRKMILINNLVLQNIRQSFFTSKQNNLKLAFLLKSNKIHRKFVLI